MKWILESSQPKRVQRETHCLRKLGGKHNVVRLLFCLRHSDTTVLALDFFEHEPFREYFTRLTIRETQAYMRGLMEALAHVHASGIVHRDVKPANFLYDRMRGKFALVDFGLAQVWGDDGVLRDPNAADAELARGRSVDRFGKRRAAPKPKSLSTVGVRGIHGKIKKENGPGAKELRESNQAARAGTRGFRAPEVLFKVKQQSSAIDIWSAGVIMLTILSGRSPFFMSNDDTEGLAEYSETFGHSYMADAASKLGKEYMLSEGIKAPLKKRAGKDLGKQRSFKQICSALQSRNLNGPQGGKVECRLPSQAFALLQSLLSLCPQERSTASDSLAHPFLNMEVEDGPLFT